MYIIIVAPNNQEYVVDVEESETTMDINKKRNVDKKNPHPNICRDPYFWTHGVCGHVSVIYTKQVPGHQVQAMETSKLGGSSTIILVNIL